MRDKSSHGALGNVPCKVGLVLLSSNERFELAPSISKGGGVKSCSAVCKSESRYTSGCYHSGASAIAPYHQF